MTKLINNETLSYYSIFLAAMLLPIKTSFSNVGILLLLCLSVFSIFVNRGNYYILKKPWFYLGTTLALFFPLLIGAIYAPSTEKAFFQLSKCSFYLLVPILIIRKDLSAKKMLYWSTTGIIIGSIFSMCLLLAINFHKYFSLDLPISKLFSYEYTGLKFISPLRSMHPIYLGSYYLFMLILIWQSNYPIKKNIKLLITVMGVVTMIFLNSRAIFFIGTFLFLIFLIKNLSLTKSLLTVTTAIIILTLLQPFLQQTYIYNKLVKGTQWELSDNVAKHNIDSKRTSDSRMSRWLVSLDLIKEKPFLGYGTGAARDLLASEYKEREMYASMDERFDSHNQYLGFAIQVGLFGIVFLLSYFITNFYWAFQNKDFILFSYVIIVGGLCIIENYLIRNMGINFVAIFGTILLYKNLPND